jgi:hypothetical protein
VSRHVSPTGRNAPLRCGERRIANQTASCHCGIVVPYQEPKVAGDSGDFNGAISSTLPMAAMFMRNKFIGWAAVVYSMQTWLSESEEARKKASTPGYLNVFMSIMALAVSYLPLFLPPAGHKGGSSTAPPQPVPLS